MENELPFYCKENERASALLLVSELKPSPYEKSSVLFSKTKAALLLIPVQSQGKEKPACSFCFLCSFFWVPLSLCILHIAILILKFTFNFLVILLCCPSSSSYSCSVHLLWCDSYLQCNCPRFTVTYREIHHKDFTKIHFFTSSLKFQT